MPETSESIEEIDMWPMCPSCNKRFTGEEFDIQGHTVCEECYNDTDFICSGCGERTWDDLDYVEGGGSCCERCTNDNYTSCDACCRLVHNDNIVYPEYSGDGAYCESCYSEIFAYCPDCCEDYYHENMIRCGCCNGNLYCEECFHGNGHEPYNGGGGVSSFWKPHRLKSEPKEKLLFGIELELGAISSSAKLYEKTNKLDKKFFNVGSDGSIRDCHDVVSEAEIRSHPATYKYLKKHHEYWDDILDWRKHKVRSYTTNSCGIHIHMDRQAFSEKQLYKFLNFFYKNPDFILKISQRNKDRLRQWANVFEENSDKEITYKAKTKQGFKRYSAVNLQGPRTIEVRIFRGTLHPISFWKNIEFLKCLYDYLKRHSVKEISVKKFIKYAKKKKRAFPNLWKWLQDNYYKKENNEDKDS